jgi:hypothetical protein
VARVPFPKMIHILTLEWKKKFKPMLSGPYVMIDQLIKSIRKVSHLNDSLT